MISIYLVPVDQVDNPEFDTMNDAHVVASGDTYKETLQKLMAAINADEVDDVNNVLRMDDEDGEDTFGFTTTDVLDRINEMDEQGTLPEGITDDDPFTEADAREVMEWLSRRVDCNAGVSMWDWIDMGIEEVIQKRNQTSTSK